jgi:hypothetical protein
VLVQRRPVAYRRLALASFQHCFDLQFHARLLAARVGKSQAPQSGSTALQVGRRAQTEHVESEELHLGHQRLVHGQEVLAGGRRDPPEASQWSQLLELGVVVVIPVAPPWS